MNNLNKKFLYIEFILLIAIPLMVGFYLMEIKGSFVGLSFLVILLAALYFPFYPIVRIKSNYPDSPLYIIFSFAVISASVIGLFLILTEAVVNKMAINIFKLCFILVAVLFWFNLFSQRKPNDKWGIVRFGVLMLLSSTVIFLF